jgi:6-phosphofructokinase 1
MATTIFPECLPVTNLGKNSFSSPLNLSTIPNDGLGDFVLDGTRVLNRVELGPAENCDDLVSFEKAGPRERLFFDPARTKAAIVTCGGLCPGLNNVIRSVFLELYHRYGVRDVLGIRYGYQGLNPETGEPPLRLTPEIVDHIHTQGGTILGSSRGPQEPATVVDFLQRQGVQILFCVGGDGTQRGAHQIAVEAQRRSAALAVVGIPKTIDNDLPFVWRSFGYSTALEKAREVIDAAHIEARGAWNGIGLVKLMGRDAGFIAAGATLASQEVNFTLIPEVGFPLEGQQGLLETLKRRIVARQHAVVVVAEGAGQHLIPGDRTERDASGNLRLHDAGLFLKDRITAYFKAEGMACNLRYLDPSYLIRSIPANSDDALLCDALARNAVHAAMAGKTDVLVGLIHSAFIHVPLPMVAESKKRLAPDGEMWMGVLEATGQPHWCQEAGSRQLVASGRE